MTFHVLNCNKTCQREQVNKFLEAFLSCIIPCEQFLNNFNLFGLGGGGGEDWRFAGRGGEVATCSSFRWFEFITS